MEKPIYPNGTEVVFQYGSTWAKRGVVVDYNEENKRYLIAQLEKSEDLKYLSYEEIRPIPTTIKRTDHVRRAYQIWILGCILSLTGIFFGQYLGEFYKQPEVYYAVSGVWAFIMGGTSAALGFFIIAKAKIE